MSKYINVNPDHYKTRGRERPGDDVPEFERKRRIAADDKTRERWERQEKLKGKRQK